MPESEERDYALIEVIGDQVVTMRTAKLSKDEAEMQNAIFQRAGWDQRWMERTKE